MKNSSRLNWTAWLLAILAFSPAFAGNLPRDRYEERRENIRSENENLEAATEALKILAVEQRTTNQLLQELVSEMRNERALMQQQLQALADCMADKSANNTTR